MSELDIIRAWKDKAYRNSLSVDELAQLPEHPAGVIELTDNELVNVDGASVVTTTTPTTVTITTATTIVSYIISVYTLTALSYLSYQYNTAAGC